MLDHPAVLFLGSVKESGLLTLELLQGCDCEVTQINKWVPDHLKP